MKENFSTESDIITDIMAENSNKNDCSKNNKACYLNRDTVETNIENKMENTNNNIMEENSVIPITVMGCEKCPGNRSNEQGNSIMRNEMHNTMGCDPYISNIYGESYMKPSRYYNTIVDHLDSQIGKYAIINFYMFPNSMIEQRGVIFEVGMNYLVLRSSERAEMTVCSFRDIKFIKIIG